MRSTERSLFRAFLATSAFLAGLVVTSTLIEGCRSAVATGSVEAPDRVGPVPLAHPSLDTGPNA